MSQPMVNGDKPSSQFLSHLTSYPVVSDGITTFKSHPYGAKSLDLANATYDRFGKPVLPYLQTPISYAAPYAKKADSLADAGLGQVETRFPIVKEDTETVKQTAFSYASIPLDLAGQGRDYLFGAWQDEYRKTANRNDNNQSLFTLAQAVISTQLRVATDVFQVLHDYLAPKAEEAKAKRDSIIDGAKKQARDWEAKGQELRDGYAAQARESADSYASEAQDAKDSYASKAQETKDSYASKAQEATNDYASRARETKDGYAAKAQERSG